MFRFFFSLIFMITLLHLCARSLCGVVVMNSGTAVEFATVGLFVDGDTRPSAVAVTDSLGRFAFEEIPDATILKATLAGMEDAVVKITPGDSMVSIEMRTKSKILKEVTVKASDRVFDGRSVLYYPSKKAKEAAAGGYDLLAGMALDNVTVDAIAKKVETAWGASVSLFINYLPATPAEMTNLLATDVKRVEYVDFPTDIRFKGCQRVINIIVSEYMSGGYTKLTSTQRFISDGGEYATSSKLACRRMTFDLAVGYDCYSSRHSGYDNTQTFDFGDMTIVRREKTDFNRESSRTPYVTLRTVFSNGGKTTLSNTIGFLFDKKPEDEKTGTVDFSSVYDTGRFSRRHSSRAATPSWSGSLYFTMPNDINVYLSGSAGYTRRHSSSSYLASDNDMILSNATEDAWIARWSAAAGKQTGRVYLSWSVSAAHNGNDMAYDGTTVSQSRLRQTSLTTSPVISFDIGQISVNASLGFNYLRYSVDSNNACCFNMSPDVTVFWKPSRKLSTQLTLRRQTVTTPIDQRGDDIIRRSEIEWTAGNPFLDNYPSYTAVLTTRWLLSPTVTLGANLHVNRLDNKVVCTWTRIIGSDCRQAVLQSYINSGSFTSFMPTLSVTGRFFARSLVVSGVIRPMFYSQSGLYSGDMSSQVWSLQASYYFGQFNISGRYQSSSRLLTNYMANYVPATYSLSAGWSHRRIIVRASAVNLFSSSYRSNRQIVDNGDYYGHNLRYNPSAHRHFIVTISYSVNYGRKVKEDKGPGKTSAVGSGIIN